MTAAAERPDWTHLIPIDHENIESVTPLPLALADIIGSEVGS